MELQTIMPSEISQSPKNQRPNISSDKWMPIHSCGGEGHGRREVGKNEGTLDCAEGSERRDWEVGMGRTVE